ncbi:MAG: thiol-disulfide isomerase/thioredoxin [Saprospiraceae bacterium]|jgi:thiol-disulfide isomerase/thioredoxin|uniref:TlpA family protein disulfide reductase n=1 Tax=Patiriisocius sp. Uisw_047 TaxID=3230969 RepID=UPI0039E9A4D5
MKKTFILLCLIAIVACNEEKEMNDYVTFSGKITNKKTDSIRIAKRGFSKVILVNADGTFSDTLKVTPGIYYFDDSNESTAVFLRNGYELDMTIDTAEYDESVEYSGYGSEQSNFLAEKSMFEQKLFGDDDFGDLDEAGLDTKIAAMKKEAISFMDSKTAIDTMLIRLNKEGLDGLMKSMKGYYGEMIALKRDLPLGMVSPTWTDYENYNGGTTSLSDLKGKNVYVDVWATWCGPCKAEIPSLKKLEHDYEGKNIAFVSMSIDDNRSHGGSWDQAKIDWKKMVGDKQLGGIQIYAPKGWQSQFVHDYKITGIPRFILIDTEGKIVDSNAPRPSSEKIRVALDGLL